MSWFTDLTVGLGQLGETYLDVMYPEQNQPQVDAPVTTASVQAIQSQSDEQLFGIKKDYVIIGGIVLGAIVLLKVIK